MLEGMNIATKKKTPAKSEVQVAAVVTTLKSRETRKEFRQLLAKELRWLLGIDTIPPTVH